MQSTPQEYPNRNRKLIYIFIWSLRWIIFCRFLSLSLLLIFARVILPFDGCRNSFLCVAFFIRWIAKAESKRIESNEYEIYIRLRNTHARTQMIVQSCKWKENKDKAKKYTLVHIHEKRWQSYATHKWYELQNNSIEKEWNERANRDKNCWLSIKIKIYYTNINPMFDLSNALFSVSVFSFGFPWNTTKSGKMAMKNCLIR